MKVEISDEERENIIKEISRMLYHEMQEKVSLRVVISQEIKRYFNEEKRIKEEEDERIKQMQNDNEKKWKEFEDKID